MRRVLVAPVLALGLTATLAACGSNGSSSSDTTATNAPAAAGDTTSTSMPMSMSTMPKSSATLTAADVRAKLEFALQEHVYLAGSATGEALAGNTKGFDGAAAALGQNSNDVTGLITAVYGDAAGKAFDPLWKKHIGFFVAYTQAIAKGDRAAADKAVADLTAYASEFGAFIESATNGGLKKDAVASLLGRHAQTLIAAIDAQKAGDAKSADMKLKQAAAHMTMIAEPLAAAIAKQQGYSGDATSPAADLRATLNRNLQEHVYLAGLATGQALAGNTKGFDAAAATLDTSSNDLIGAVSSVYGDAAGKAFDPLWKKHIGFFVAYTQAIAKGDRAAADKAVADLTAYAGEFGAFIESATNGGLKKDAVASLLTGHAQTLIAAIDAQKAGDPMKAYANLKKAAAHMPMIADPLAAAIAKQKNLS